MDWGDLWWVPLLLLVGVAFWLGHRARERELAEWAGELVHPRELRDSLVPLLGRLQAEVPALGTSREARRAARDYEKARTHFTKGVPALEEAESLGEGRRGRGRLSKAIGELRLAQRDVRSAIASLDRASSLGVAVSSGAVSTTSTPGPRPGFRECCFFCSRPLPPAERIGPMVDIRGQRRQVTACEPHALEAQVGRPPPIRAVDRSGLLIPWFASPDYDPYRDYAPSYSLGIDASDLPFAFLDAALGLSYPILQRPLHWYADDEWEPGYRTRYWESHDRWAGEGGWETHRGAPETPLEMRGAPETSFAGGPTAAETAFAAGFGAAPAERSAGVGRADMDSGSGRDLS